jgi:hypothetical protein
MFFWGDRLNLSPERLQWSPVASRQLAIFHSHLNADFQKKYATLK